MKPPLILFGLFSIIISPEKMAATEAPSRTTIGAESASAVLLCGAVQKQDGLRSVVSGHAIAIINTSRTGTDMTIAASEIVYDPGRNLLECSGEVTIRADGGTIRSKDVSVQLGAAMAKVFLLSPEGLLAARVSSQAPESRDSTVSPAEPVQH